MAKTQSDKLAEDLEEMHRLQALADEQRPALQLLIEGSKPENKKISQEPVTVQEVEAEMEKALKMTETAFEILEVRSQLSLAQSKVLEDLTLQTAQLKQGAPAITDLLDTMQAANRQTQQGLEALRQSPLFQKFLGSRQNKPGTKS